VAPEVPAMLVTDVVQDQLAGIELLRRAVPGSGLMALSIGMRGGLVGRHRLRGSR